MTTLLDLLIHRFEMIAKRIKQNISSTQSHLYDFDADNQRLQFARFMENFCISGIKSDFFKSVRSKVASAMEATFDEYAFAALLSCVERATVLQIKNELIAAYTDEVNICERNFRLVDNANFDISDVVDDLNRAFTVEKFISIDKIQQYANDITTQVSLIGLIENIIKLFIEKFDPPSLGRIYQNIMVEDEASFARIKDLLVMNALLVTSEFSSYLDRNPINNETYKMHMEVIHNCYKRFNALVNNPVTFSDIPTDFEHKCRLECLNLNYGMPALQSAQSSRASSPDYCCSLPKYRM